MSDQTRPPPINEPGRIVAVTLAVAPAKMFVHPVTPNRAETVKDRPKLQRAS